jgi:anthranilate synthase component 1
VPVIRLSAIPDLFALHAQHPDTFPVLLETTVGLGWDVLMAYPSATYCYDMSQGGDFLTCLAQEYESQATQKMDEHAHLPFRGGWFVYLGYELLHVIEPSVVSREPDMDQLPTAALMRIPAAIMVDKTRQQAWVFAEDDVLLSTLLADLADVSEAKIDDPILDELVEEDDVIFLEGVRQIQQYIAAGDVFQVNLSRRWRGQLHQPNAASAIYQSLRKKNPAPFSGCVRLRDGQYIISSSPERLVQVHDGHALTRPIAGTHPRHADSEEDAKLKANLIAHPKERAEHVMLVDLERNDLGRICVPGTVIVDELMEVATYQHVHHIESTVTGQLQEGITPVDLIKALFPGGTITGCPKVRTMQIIRELENTPRGAYTGSMGYINLDGDLDLNILIRTLSLSAQQLTFSAGAGIVVDSDPLRELAETRAKAKGLLRAFGLM